MSEKPKIKVLYVDDERNNLVSFKANFRIDFEVFTDMETVIEAVNKGKIYQYVRKPYVAEELKKLIQDAFDTYEAAQKIKRDNEQYEFILRQKLLS